MDEEDENGQKENHSPASKRPKVVNAGTQMIPKKESVLLDVGVDYSPMTKSLIQKIQGGERINRLAREAIETRRRSKEFV